MRCRRDRADNDLETAIHPPDKIARNEILRVFREALVPACRSAGLLAPRLRN